jgi:hypothetical protein
MTPATAAAARTRPTQKARAKAQAPAPQTEITKEKIEAIVAAFEQAGKKKDFAVILPLLAPDFTYKSEGNNRPTRRANRAQYIESIKLGSALVLDYTYVRKSLTITIAPDGQSATAHTEAFEMLTMAQGTVAGNATSLTTFRIYKGKIMIASMEGTVDYV